MLRLCVLTLIIGWLLGSFVFDLGAPLHLVMLVAANVLFVHLFRRRAVA